MPSSIAGKDTGVVEAILFSFARVRETPYDLAGWGDWPCESRELWNFSISSICQMLAAIRPT
jgi:hypothetical protein